MWIFPRLHWRSRLRSRLRILITSVCFPPEKFHKENIRALYMCDRPPAGQMYVMLSYRGNDITESSTFNSDYQGNSKWSITAPYGGVQLALRMTEGTDYTFTMPTQHFSGHNSTIQSLVFSCLLAFLLHLCFGVLYLCFFISDVMRWCGMAVVIYIIVSWSAISFVETFSMSYSRDGRRSTTKVCASAMIKTGVNLLAMNRLIFVRETRLDRCSGDVAADWNECK